MADFLRNLGKEPLGVNHADLERFDPEVSAYKSICPHDDCNGVLLVARDQKTLKLLAKDRCQLCGQPVVYLDIKRLRDREG